MFDKLTPAEKVKLGSKLQSAAVQFLREYDALKAASPATMASYYGPGSGALATDWLMACVEAGQIQRDLAASWQS